MAKHDSEKFLAEVQSLLVNLKIALQELVKGFTNNASLKRSRIFRGNSITPLLESQYGIKIGDDLLNKNAEVVGVALMVTEAVAVTAEHPPDAAIV